MCVASVLFAGVLALTIPEADSFLLPAVNRLAIPSFTTRKSTRGWSNAVVAVSPPGGFQYPTGVVSKGEELRLSTARSAAADGVGGNVSGDDGGEQSDVERSQEEEPGSAAAPARQAAAAAEPVGAAGAMEDDMLVKLVGQDYGMMALLRNDKFRGLIVLLRNIPPNEWVSAVAQAYPGDDEVKGMLGQVGKLMRMIDYYEAKKPKT